MAPLRSGAFHRAIAVMLVALAGLVAAVALARNHGAAEAGLLVGLLGTSALVARLLLRDLRAHPAKLPRPQPIARAEHEKILIASLLPVWPR